MINVFFTEQSAGIMKLNQKKGRIGADEEILCLGFMLEQGDISQPADSRYREDYILKMFGQSGYLSEESDTQELRHAVQRYSDDLHYLIKRAEEGAEIRVWNEMTPASIAGFYHLCSILDPFDIGFQYIEVPRRFHNPIYTQAHNSLTTSLFDRLEELLALEMHVPCFDVKYYASLWENLVYEGASLRAMVNGQMISVPDSMFDFIILKHLDMPKQEVAVIGEILMSDQKRLSDYWIASRIQQMIDEGLIEVLEDSEYPYERTIIRTN